MDRPGAHQPLPASLRIDNIPPDILETLQDTRKSGLTFAPEAGSQRLRDAINKNISEQEIMDTCAAAFREGYTSVKLYFMIGLPTETDEDILAIAKLAQDIVNLYYSLPERQKGEERQRERVPGDLCAQALHALPVGAAAHHGRNRAPPAASAGRHPHPESVRELARPAHVGHRGPHLRAATAAWRG